MCVCSLTPLTYLYLVIWLESPESQLSKNQLNMKKVMSKDV